MAAYNQTHARIRLNFVNLPLDSAWMLIEYKKLPLISDVIYEIKKRYFKDTFQISLSLQGSCLPLQEKSFLLRDEDVVTVRIDEQGNESSQENRDIKISSDSTNQEKKKRKRKHEETEETLGTEEPLGEYSVEEDRKAEKRRKKEKKRKEKERLREIAEMVNPFTERTSNTSMQSSKVSGGKDHTSGSKIDTEAPLKRARLEDNEMQHTSSRDVAKVFDGSHASISGFVASSSSISRAGSSTYEENKDSNTCTDTGKKHKKKRKRKHRKHKHKDMSVEKFAMTPVQESASTGFVPQVQSNETVARTESDWRKQENIYKGYPVDVSKTFYGALPDKLLQPKYYRHEYHNLREYSAVPNKLTKFTSDSENEEKEETQNYEQYNFLCSTRYSEFQESNSQESVNNISASPGVLSDQMNNSTLAYRSSSAPNANNSMPNKTDNSAIKSDNELDNTNHEIHTNSEIRNETVLEKEMPGQFNHNNSNCGSFRLYNGYSETNSENKGGTPAPSTLVQSKLPNGVTVYSRQRRSYPKTELFSKEEQLNTVATNRSFIYKNPDEIAMNDVFEVDPGETLEAVKVKKDYTEFPALAGPPRIGDKIAYRILEMSSAYTPEVSDYKEAEVISFDQTTQNVHLKNISKSDDNKDLWPNKFDVAIEDGDTLLTSVQPESDETMLHWSSLLEPRLVS